MFFRISIYAEFLYFIDSIRLILNLVAWQCTAVAGTVASLEEVCGFDCNKGLSVNNNNQLPRPWRWRDETNLLFGRQTYHVKM